MPANVFHIYRALDRLIPTNATFSYVLQMQEKGLLSESAIKQAFTEEHSREPTTEELTLFRLIVEQDINNCREQIGLS